MALPGILRRLAISWQEYFAGDAEDIAAEIGRGAETSVGDAGTQTLFTED